MLHLLTAIPLLLATPGAADSSLLVDSTPPNSMGHSGSAFNHTEVAYVTFEFGYVGGIFGGVCELERVGCDTIPVSNFQTGSVFDFDMNSPHFSSVE